MSKTDFCLKNTSLLKKRTTYYYKKNSHIPFKLDFALVWAMLDLKKYFTDGLIQVAILLSLAGMHMDVDPYLPLGRILVGPSSDVTQSQFHNLRNMLDGYHIHPKSVDLDGFFTARRLLSWVRSLDHLQVPATELEAWLVHREPDNGVSIPSQMGFLENGGLEDVEDPSELSMRLNGGELEYDIGEEDTFGAVGHMSRSLTHPDQDEVIKEVSCSFAGFNKQLGKIFSCLVMSNLYCGFLHNSSSKYLGMGSCCYQQQVCFGIMYLFYCMFPLLLTRATHPLNIH